jgi:hypothetical protein
MIAEVSQNLTACLRAVLRAMPPGRWHETSRAGATRASPVRASSWAVGSRLALEALEALVPVDLRSWDRDDPRHGLPRSVIVTSSPSLTRSRMHSASPSSPRSKQCAYDHCSQISLTIKVCLGCVLFGVDECGLPHELPSGTVTFLFS